MTNAISHRAGLCITCLRTPRQPGHCRCTDCQRAWDTHHTPKETEAMTTDQTPIRSDFRRAAALITHRATGNRSGIQFVIDEAGEGNRTTQLLRGVIAGYQKLVAELRTDHALLAIGQFIQYCAENSDDDIRRGAVAIIARRDGDIDTFNAVLVEANDTGLPGLLVSAVVELHSTLLPELSTPYGIEYLQQWTARIAESEDDDPGAGSTS